MTRVSSLLVCVVVLARPDFAVAAPPTPIQGGYSTKPLERAVYDPAYVAVDAAAFNNWLNENYDSLDAERMKGPREHLYYLIDSYAKMVYAREGVVLPPRGSLLQILSPWSERLGVYGGRLVYEAAKSPDAPAAPAVTPVPSGFALALRDDMLVLTSESGHWSIAVPYYFMIWGISELEPPDGPKTQVVSISTGAARHEGQEGHSQATLTLFFGPGADSARFVSYWASQLGFTGGEPKQDLQVRSLSSRHRFDDRTKLHWEYTFWSSPRGPFVVAYLGLDGTYQWNRPHYADFLRSIQDK